jgi:hypothetical protein
MYIATPEPLKRASIFNRKPNLSFWRFVISGRVYLKSASGCLVEEVRKRGSVWLGCASDCTN